MPRTAMPIVTRYSTANWVSGLTLIGPLLGARAVHLPAAPCRRTVLVARDSAARGFLGETPCAASRKRFVIHPRTGGPSPRFLCSPPPPPPPTPTMGLSHKLAPIPWPAVGFTSRLPRGSKRLQGNAEDGTHERDLLILPGETNTHFACLQFSELLFLLREPDRGHCNQDGGDRQRSQAHREPSPNRPRPVPLQLLLSPCPQASSESRSRVHPRR